MSLIGDGSLKLRFDVDLMKDVSGFVDSHLQDQEIIKKVGEIYQDAFSKQEIRDTIRSYREILRWAHNSRTNRRVRSCAHCLYSMDSGRTTPSLSKSHSLERMDASPKKDEFGVRYTPISGRTISSSTLDENDS